MIIFMIYQGNQISGSAKQDSLTSQVDLPSQQQQQQHYIENQHLNIQNSQIISQSVRLCQFLIKSCSAKTMLQKEQNEKIKKIISTLRLSSNDGCQQSLKDLQLKLQEVTKFYEESNNSNIEKQIMIKQLQKQLAVAHQIVFDSKQNNKQISVNTQLQMLNSETYNNDFEVKDAQNGDYTAVLSELQKQKNQNLRLIEKYDILSKQTNELKNQNESQRKELEHIKIRYDDLKRELQKTNKNGENFKQYISKKEEQLCQLQKQIAELNKTLGELSQKVDQLNKSLNQKVGQSENQKQQIKSKEDQILKLKESISLFESRELQVQKKTQIKQKEESQDSIDDYDKQMTEEQVKFIMLQENNEKLRKELSQMEMLSGLAREEVRIMNEKLRSKELQLFQLQTTKNTRIQQLQAIICSREEELYQLKSNNQIYPKSNMANLEVEYNKPRQGSYASSRSSQSQFYCDKDKQQDILQAELQILKCKYKLLEKMYLQLKNSSEEEMSEKQKKNMSIQVLQSELEIDREEKPNLRKSISNASERPLKKTLTDYNLSKEQTEKHNLDLSIAGDSVKGLNKNSTLNSPQSIPALTLNSYFTSSELQNRIKKFSYNNSILYKINSSKFITNPSSKMAFIIQYACFLQLYFSAPFLSSVLEDMIMGEDMEVRDLKFTDLSVQIIDSSQVKSSSRLNYSRGREENSILSESSSRALSSANLHLAKQFSINSYSNTELRNGKKSKERLEFGIISQTIYPTVDISSIEQQMKQLEAYLSSSNFKQNKPKSEELLQRFKNVRKTAIAGLILHLLSENEAMKKCLNLMLKNEQIITKSNNDVYFENADSPQAHQKGEQDGGSRRETKKLLDQANCLIM